MINFLKLIQIKYTAKNIPINTITLKLIEKKGKLY